MTNDKAGRWLRVSSGGQDEASQQPDIDAWCASHGYDVTATYTVHGKSAYHGEQDKALNQALADMTAGKINVLVVWVLDRIERRGASYVFDLAKLVREAGGRIEYVLEPHLNTANEMSDVMLSLAATVAHMESKRKSQRVKAKHDGLRAAGSLIGRAPWGYRIVERDGRKQLEPTDEGKTWLPYIYDEVIKGRPLRAIAAELDRQGVKPMGTKSKPGTSWNEGTICNGLIPCETYKGRRPNNGSQQVAVAVVTPERWRAANETLKARRK
ncbi:MAG TPA: recombinase family protein, partial [Streptosporangiaceae bacterium]